MKWEILNLSKEFEEEEGRIQNRMGEGWAGGGGRGTWKSSINWKF